MSVQRLRPCSAAAGGKLWQERKRQASAHLHVADGVQHAAFFQQVRILRQQRCLDDAPPVVGCLNEETERSPKACQNDEELEIRSKKTINDVIKQTPSKPQTPVFQGVVLILFSP